MGVDGSDPGLVRAVGTVKVSIWKVKIIGVSTRQAGVRLPSWTLPTCQRARHPRTNQCATQTIWYSWPSVRITTHIYLSGANVLVTSWLSAAPRYFGDFGNSLSIKWTGNWNQSNPLVVLEGSKRLPHLASARMYKIMYLAGVNTFMT